MSDVACVSASQVSSHVGDEVAILDLDHSVYYGLDPVGARDGELLQKPRSLQSVLDTVLAEFEVDDATARADLLALVDELLEKKLVELRSGDAA